MRTMESYCNFHSWTSPPSAALQVKRRGAVIASEAKQSSLSAMRRLLRCARNDDTLCFLAEARH